MSGYFLNSAAGPTDTVGLRSLSNGGTGAEIHDGGDFSPYNAAGEFSGANGVIGTCGV